MSYDDWLFQLAEDYNTSCEPKKLEPDSEHHSGDYNCNNCDDIECEYWSEYND